MLYDYVDRSILPISSDEFFELSNRVFNSSCKSIGISFEWDSASEALVGHAHDPLVVEAVVVGSESLSQVWSLTAAGFLWKLLGNISIKSKTQIVSAELNWDNNHCKETTTQNHIGWNSNAHTVSFDWFLSGLEWILNLEFCLLKLSIFYQKLLWNMRFPHFEFLSLYLSLIKFFTFSANQPYLIIGLKTQNVEELSLDLIFHNNFW